MPKPLPAAAIAPARSHAAHYSDATERTFRRALQTLEATLPEHHADLSGLLDAGRFDDLGAVVALFEEGVR